MPTAGSRAHMNGMQSFVMLLITPVPLLLCYAVTTVNNQLNEITQASSYWVTFLQLHDWAPFIHLHYNTTGKSNSTWMSKINYFYPECWHMNLIKFLSNLHTVVVIKTCFQYSSCEIKWSNCTIVCFLYEVATLGINQNGRTPERPKAPASLIWVCLYILRLLPFAK